MTSAVALSRRPQSTRSRSLEVVGQGNNHLIGDSGWYAICATTLVASPRPLYLPMNFPFSSADKHQFGAFPIVCRALSSTETCAHFCDKTRSVLFQFAFTRNLPPIIIAAPPPVAPVPAYACIVPHVRGECAAAPPRRTPTEVRLLLEAQSPRLFPSRIWQGSHLSNLHPDSWRTAPLRTLAAFGQHPSSSEAGQTAR
ncbi:hypothetical protein J2Z31_001782 [Sinorhizobium kostiense]|uniref:Uncharacterized protein n=1 Tax=Sinorhizobium kostiense TaxID=76747 RepID=A0ABS4QZ37_9HYPH|nr:hypothetical protein [Sinorhizobium kostiense]